MQRRRSKSLMRMMFLFVVIAVVGMAATSLVMAQVADTTAPVVTSVTPADGSTIYANGSLTTYYQAGNTTPLVIKADYSDEAGGSGVDASMEGVMVHLDGSNMLMNCPVLTTTHVECVATSADLGPGTHPVDIYVSDLAGNLTMHRSWVTITVDSVAPSYSNLTPVDGTTIYTSQLNSASTNDPAALRIDYDLTDPDPSSGWSPMSHINDSVPPGVAGAMIMGCTKTPATNPTHYSCQMNRAGLLHLGDNTLAILLKDKVGNTSSDYTDATTRKHYNVVDDVDPAVSGLTADSLTISASYSDPLPTGALSTQLASGINSTTAMVHVDGAMIMMGCTATATGISCPTPAGLAVGPHTIEVMVTDNAGNTGMATGTYVQACTPARPTLSVTTHHAFWASYADYLARELSVNMIVNNTGTGSAYGVAITGASSTDSVTLSTATPVALGDLAGSGSTTTNLKYHVPSGVNRFSSTITGSASDACGTSYNYPETGYPV